LVQKNTWDVFLKIGMASEGTNYSEGSYTAAMFDSKESIIILLNGKFVPAGLFGFVGWQLLYCGANV
jgi:hypothetical protein